MVPLGSGLGRGHWFEVGIDMLVCSRLRRRSSKVLKTSALPLLRRRSYTSRRLSYALGRGHWFEVGIDIMTL